MRMKKLAVFVMTVLMALSLTAPALASEKKSSVVKGAVMLPDIVIDVSVPGEQYSVLNPLKLPVKIGSVLYSDEIASSPAYIVNKSKVPVDVSVTVTGAIKSGSSMTLAADKATAEASTKKTAFVYFEIVAAENDENWKAVEWADEYDAEKHIVVRTTAKSKKNMVQLGAGSDDPDVKQGDKPYGAFRLNGTMNPELAWMSGVDGITVTAAFTFAPRLDPEVLSGISEIGVLEGDFE